MSRTYFAEVEIAMLKIVCNQWVSNKQTVLTKNKDEGIIHPDTKLRTTKSQYCRQCGAGRESDI